MDSALAVICTVFLIFVGKRVNARLSKRYIQMRYNKLFDDDKDGGGKA